MKILIPAAVFLAFVFAAVPAAGQEESKSDRGFYLSIRGLGSNPTAKDDPSQVEYEMDYGYGGIAAIGYALANPGYGVNFRFEIEGGYRMYELKEAFDPLGAVCGGVLLICTATGDFNVATAMANIYFDFNTGSNLLPSFGVGYGRGRFFFDDWSFNGSPPSSIRVDADVYQAMVGIGYKITPGMILDTEYRFLQPNDSSMNGFFSNEFTIGLRLIL